MAQDTIQIIPNKLDDRPLYIKIAGKITPKGVHPVIDDVKERLKITPYSKQLQLNEETFGKDTYRDVFRERFGEHHPGYPRLMQIADSLAKANNTPNRSWSNKRRKEALRKVFDDLELPRKY